MKRRDFITLVGGTAVSFVSLPLSARAQQSTKNLVSASSTTRPSGTPSGMACGTSVTWKVQYRYAGGLPDRLALVAVELVHRPVDLIATFGTPPTLAAKQATTTIPIVMMGVGDPVGAGLVTSLARPGGNITGNTILGPEVAGKRLQLLKEVIPSLSRVAFLWNPDNASHPASSQSCERR